VVGQDFAGVFQQRFARGRGLHAAAPAHQQCCAHGVFQRGQAFADGRSHQRLLLGGTGDVARVADGDEQAQRGQVQVTHGFMIFPFGNSSVPNWRL